MDFAALLDEFTAAGVMSGNNFNFLQRTLLLQFFLEK